ncbi:MULTISPECIES: hypothetical protein [unclassified Listeria]|uniref:hypothetical protein n=1 Tax=unclassified Listeria TaxID=2642072 RepID=UPI000B59454C|nr:MULTISPECIES: hypothetical protein [unclassified Listeria]
MKRNMDTEIRLLGFEAVTSRGFENFLSKRIYIREIGRFTMLVIEVYKPDMRIRLGEKPRSGGYVYDFYKARYERKDGKMTHQKVYGRQLEAPQLLAKVRGFLNYINANNVKMK